MNDDIIACLLIPICLFLFIAIYSVFSDIQGLKNELNDLGQSITKQAPKQPPQPKFGLVRANIAHYTASKDETDGNPCRTADGTNICPTTENIVANNCLPFNTRVEIGDMGMVYRVADRMNSRYSCEWFDILVADKATAKNRGVLYNKEVKIYD